MSQDLIKLAIGAAVLAGGTYIAWRFRHQLREKVAAWLRNHNLEKSALMEVLLVCDRIAGSINQFSCKVFAITRQTGEQKISEEVVSLDTLKKSDPDVYALLENRGYARKSILQQVK
ncbi:hypothetical protein B9G53_01155 [Pseudanabaena sp. SR411]|uniref:hypothetical protein n=1 Tax=Pseudanabaena sp. SR411 TaxID=1980935 RepID=UPI000B98CAC8|nr:hypothetical protein [Pseudanabaena sp. SR411]OYQ67490.1 hypothetical protein B9G53_01155 [Pseudanabaena sp. SR411]